MKYSKPVIAVILLSALAATSCTISYKLKARKWGMEIEKAVKLVQEVGSSAQANPMATQQKEWKDANMPKLDEAKALLNAVKFSIEAASAPGSLSDAHQNLQTGVSKLIEAITVLQDAITFGNAAKAAEFQKLRQEAETALVSARNKLTGGK